MRYRDVAERLRARGCVELRSGIRKPSGLAQPGSALLTTVPDWGAKDLAPGTVRALLRELGISRQDFGPIK